VGRVALLLTIVGIRMLRFLPASLADEVADRTAADAAPTDGCPGDGAGAGIAGPAPSAFLPIVRCCAAHWPHDPLLHLRCPQVSGKTT